MGFSFGYISEINAEVALGSFIMMIAFLIGFDHLTRLLEWSLEDVPIYNHMLQHIYKEIMIMGVVSFCIGMYQTTDEAQEADNQEWIIGVDFAHYILFYMAFFFVMHAFYLILLAMATAKAFDSNHAMPVAVVRDLVPPGYGRLNTLIFNYSPISNVREKLEYKIVYVLFRDTYQWVTLDFDFARYLTGCLQHYALKVMSAGSFSWLVIVTLIVLNYARIKLGGDSYLNCGSDKFVSPHSYHNATADDDHSRLLDVQMGQYYGESSYKRVLAASTTSAEVSDECNVNALRAFFLCGVMLCAVTLIFLFVSRMYLSRLIRKSGCESPEDYSNFLALEEETVAQERREAAVRAESNGESPADSFRANAEASSVRMAEIKQQRHGGANNGRQVSLMKGTQHTRSKSRRMSLGTAARSIDELKKKAASEEDEIYQHLFNSVSSYTRKIKKGIEAVVDWFEYGWMYLFRRAAYNRMIEKKRALEIGETRSSQRSSLFNKRVAPDPQHNDVNVTNNERPVNIGQSVEEERVRKRVTVLHLGNISEQSASTVAKFRMQKLASGRSTFGALSRKGSVSPFGGKAAGDPESNINQSQDFSDIYLWNSPKLFFTSIETLFSLNCFYLAMWCTNFISIVNDVTEYNIIGQIVMLFPIVLIMPCLGQIVKTASLLNAISELDLNVMAMVFEDTQDRMTFLQLLRERIIEHVDTSDVMNNTPELVVSNLFAEINGGDNSSLTKKEFNIFFTLLDLNYSDDKFNHLYKTIDLNKDGSISKQELCAMVFPELSVLEKASNLLLSHSLQNKNNNSQVNIASPLTLSGSVTDPMVGILGLPSNPSIVSPVRKEHTLAMDIAIERAKDLEKKSYDNGATTTNVVRTPSPTG